MTTTSPEVEVRCSVSDLLRALAQRLSVITPESATDVWHGVLIQAADVGHLLLTTTDVWHARTVRIPGTIRGTDAVVVGSDALARIAIRVPYRDQSSTTVRVFGPHALKLEATTGADLESLPTWCVEDFPLPPPAGIPFAHLDREELVAALRCVAATAGWDVRRYAYYGVQVALTRRAISLAATNGYQADVRRVPYRRLISHRPQSAVGMVDRQVLASLVEDFTDRDVVVSARRVAGSEPVIELRCGDVTVTVELACRRLVPMSELAWNAWNRSVTVERQSIVVMVERARHLAQCMTGSPKVSLVLDRDGLTIEPTDSHTRGRIAVPRLPAVTFGIAEPIMLTFRAERLAAALATVDGPLVTLLIPTLPQSGVVIAPSVHDGRLPWAGRHLIAMAPAEGAPDCDLHSAGCVLQ